MLFKHVVFNFSRLTALSGNEMESQISVRLTNKKRLVLEIHLKCNISIFCMSCQEQKSILTDLHVYCNNTVCFLITR